MKTEKIQLIEWKLERGELDEVVSHEVKAFHLERMDKDHIWIGLTLKDGSITHINLQSKRKIKGMIENSA